MNIDFNQRVAFVSGAGGGMGWRIAQDLVEAGADVLMFDLKEEPDAAPEGPGRWRYIAGDLTDAGAVDAAVETAVDEFGGVDLLANVAGALWFDQDRSALEIDLETWDRVMTINLKSMVHTARAVVPRMRARGGGAMVHFSSTQCLRGDPAPQDAYQAAKAGVIALSKSLAIQLAGANIRSNVILPGPTESPMQQRWQENPAGREAVAKAVPLGRVGRVEDMSAACLFLLSEQAAFITGTELLVDGGLLARP